MFRHAIRSAHRLPKLAVLAALVSSAHLLAQQAHVPIDRVPHGPITFIPENPAPTPADSPGKHIIRSEDSFGDHTVTTYVIPPMHAAVPSPGRVSINDPLWGITAATIGLPAGWVFVGSLHRDDPCAKGDPEIAFRLTSPDGILMELMTPFFTSSRPIPTDGLHSLHCRVTVQGTLSAAVILTRYILPSLYPGARILSKPEDTPGTADWVKQSTTKIDSASFTAEAKRIRIGLSYNGRPSEAWIAVQTQLLHSTGYDASESAVTTVVAPAGRLEEATKLVDRLDLQIDPAWMRQETQRVQSVAAEQNQKLFHPPVSPQSHLLGEDKPDIARRPIDPGYHLNDYQAPPQTPKPQQ